jgi:integrase
VAVVGSGWHWSATNVLVDSFIAGTDQLRRQPDLPSHSPSQSPHEGHEGQTKTRSPRDISIDETLAAFLSQRQAEQRDYASKVGTALVDDPYLLSRSADGAPPCLPDGLTAGYARFAKALGIPGHFHELRHFAATAANGSGAGFLVGVI